MNNPPKEAKMAAALPHQPPVMGIPLHHQAQGTLNGAWSTGLYDCFDDIPNCCITCWCPFITFGQVSEIVDQGTTSCAVNGAIYGILLYATGCACVYSWLYRSKMRSSYMLQETPCNDCCVHCWCDSCALCQEYRELQHRGFDVTIGWEGNVQRQRSGGVMMVPPAPFAYGSGMTR